MGWSEQFTDVAFDKGQPEGDIESSRILGHASGQLLA